METGQVETSVETSSLEPKGDEKATPAKSPKAKSSSSGPLFTLKKWNAVAMWQWDVECDTCAICRVQVMGKYAVLEIGMRRECVCVS